MIRGISDLVFDNAFTIVLAAIVVVCISVPIGVALYDRRASIKQYLEHRRQVRIQRGIEMGRKQKAAREAYVLGLLADVVTDGLEEAWFAGKISSDERNWCYRKIGNRGVHDLIPKRTQAQIKSMVKGRRQRGAPSPAQEHPAWGEPTPRPSKTVEAPTNVINAKKRFGAKALDRLQKTA